jgi:hypothetical protein
LQTPFDEVYDGCGDCKKRSKRKEQGLQALITGVESSSLGVVSCQFEIRIEWPILSVVVASPANSKFEWPIVLAVTLSPANSKIEIEWPILSVVVASPAKSNLNGQ